jgi:hypothetical protein
MGVNKDELVHTYWTTFMQAIMPSRVADLRHSPLIVQTMLSSALHTSAIQPNDLTGREDKCER